MSKSPNRQITKSPNPPPRPVSLAPHPSPPAAPSPLDQIPAALHQPPASNGMVEAKPRGIAITAPMLRLRGQGPQGEGPFARRRLNLELAPTERRALRDLMDGLIAAGELVPGRNRPVERPHHAIQWLLQRLGSEFGK